MTDKKGHGSETAQRANAKAAKEGQSNPRKSSSAPRVAVPATGGVFCCPWESIWKRIDFPFASSNDMAFTCMERGSPSLRSISVIWRKLDV